ncbi:short-chain dehydrogenase [Lysobacter sp. Root559]|uniref:SDR family oxidoreductase n=1 Tax=Lysobacter sp. Root559 TaxID=1736559 RepID=UPI0006FB0FD7|nr:SDR family oxidoreductase [Lysobacter sp. Root559]KQZ55579.1 short-chain dehydrogenase [Lysobacter sp. Root559]
MKIEGSIALVTGANRGLGAAFARGLLAAGASKVYAAARDPASVSLPGVVPVRLDVTQPEQIAALARELGEVTLLVNNAGIAEFRSLLDPNALDALHRQFETNAVGPLRLVQAFAPILAGNGGGAVINVLSVLSWLTMPGSGGYSASKAAGWALGNALRQELKAQDTELLAVHSAVIDTDMGRGAPGEKIAPEDLVQQAIAALQAGQPELLADPTTHHVHAGLVAQPRVYIGASS